MAVVQFFEPSEARAAYRRPPVSILAGFVKQRISPHRGLAYRSYKHQPLYLEWAPLGLVRERQKGDLDPKAPEAPKPVEEDVDDGREYATLFVKNLNFCSSEDNLRDHLTGLGVRNVRAVSIVKREKVRLYEHQKISASLRNSYPLREAKISATLYCTPTPSFPRN